MRADLLRVPDRLVVVRQAPHADLNNFPHRAQLCRAIHPRRMVQISGCSVPRVEVRVEMHDGYGDAKGTDDWERDAVISS